MMRFFLGQDSSSHWYLVPAAKRAEWETWCMIPDDDERGWEPPEWAQRIDGYHVVTFAEPEIE